MRSTSAFGIPVLACAITAPAFAAVLEGFPEFDSCQHAAGSWYKQISDRDTAGHKVAFKVENGKFYYGLDWHNSKAGKPGLTYTEHALSRSGANLIIKTGDRSSIEMHRAGSGFEGVSHVSGNSDSTIYFSCGRIW